MSDFDPHAPLGVCQHCQGPLSDCLLGCAYAEQLRAAADPTGPRLALGGDIWALRVEPGEAPVLPPLVEPPARPGLWEAKANPRSRGFGHLDIEDPELQSKARAALATEQARRDAERGRPRGNMGPAPSPAEAPAPADVRALLDALPRCGAAELQPLVADAVDNLIAKRLLPRRSREATMEALWPDAERIAHAGAACAAARLATPATAPAVPVAPDAGAGLSVPDQLREQAKVWRTRAEQTPVPCWHPACVYMAKRCEDAAAEIEAIEHDGAEMMAEAEAARG